MIRRQNRFQRHFIDTNTKNTHRVDLDLRRFRPDCGTFACNSLESVFDTCHGASTPTGFTLEEKDSRVLLQDCVRGSTGVTGHVFWKR